MEQYGFLALLISFITHHASGEQSFVFSGSSPIQPLKPISMSALGRPFNLGDLYDRKRDVIIQGPKLWTWQETQKFSQVKTHGTNFEISSSESIDEAMSKLDISASLKTSFMSGMVEVSGSAAYLKDKKRKNNQARVSLKYSSTTFKRTLSPELFTKVSYPDVLLKTTSATDVVVAIQYGAGAVFIFDKDVEDNETRSNIEGFLEVAVRNIPSFSIEGSGKVKISEEKRRKLERFSCKFHGDFVLKDHPGNYEEAVRVYKELPSMIGESYENSIPVKVWLYPIDKLPLSSHSLKVQDLEQGVITVLTEKMEELENFIRQCNDIIDTKVASNHERIKRNVMNLKGKIEEYILVFKEKLADLVPKVREGTKVTKDLTDIINDKEKSPFNSAELQKLISFYAEEVNVLTSIQNLPNYFKDDGDFSAKLINDRQYMIGLVMQFSTKEDDYLSVMDRYLETRSGSIRTPDISKRSKWWRANSPILQELQKLSSILNTYHSLEMAKEKQGLQTTVQFYVREQTMKNPSEKPQVFLELYENGRLKQSRYSIPSETSKPTSSDKTHNLITVTWEKPSISPTSVKSYVVSTYVVNNTFGQSSCNHQLCLIDKVSTSESKVNIENLSPATEYFFQVSTFGEFGQTAVSLMSEAIETRRCPPGTYLTPNQHCNRCPAGSYTDKYDMEFCTKCPRGTYNDEEESKTCKPCPVGYYSDVLGGAVVCSKCPAGTYTSSTGSQSISDCTACPLGTYSPHPGQTSVSSCQKCGMGTFNPNVGEQRCYFCPFGTQSTVTGARSVESCQMSGASRSQIESAVNEVKGLVQKNMVSIKASAQRNQNNVANFKRAASNFNTEVRNKIKVSLQDIRKRIDDGMNVAYACQWVRGDGKGDGEYFVGFATSFANCLEKCFEKKKRNPKVNGATIHPVDKRCWCEINMKSIGDTQQIQTCKFS